MAGDWIPMRLDLVEDPAVIAMADALGMSEQSVVGYLHSVWSWASRQCNGGSVTGVTLAALARVTRCGKVADAMVQVGWLKEVIVDDKPSIEFPNWDRWLSQSAKQRALTARRVADSRLRKCNAGSVTKSLPQKRRVQERRVQKNKKKSPLPPSIPEALNTPEFLQAWNEWQEFRRQKHATLTALSMHKQLSQFSEWGIARSIAAIEHTIRKGWQGLREPDPPAGNGSPKRDIVGEMLHRSKPDADTQ